MNKVYYKVYYKIYDYGTIRWYKEGTEILHREDGSALECSNGDKGWYQHGRLYREDGPAIEYANGSKHWYQHGKLHREDGPAIELYDGNKQYWLNNFFYSNINNDEEWIIFQIIN